MDLGIAQSWSRWVNQPECPFFNGCRSAYDVNTPREYAT
jgi:hypothetical protein